MTWGTACFYLHLNAMAALALRELANRFMR